jgi:5'-3' exonuclease
VPRPLLAVDAPSLLYRAFYALPKSITDDAGKPVNALLGSLNIVLREVELHDPRAVAMCFGVDAARYRVELYGGYHADRPPVPDELGPQFADAPAVYEALGWHVFASDEFEADDLLGSLAAIESEAGGEALILTGDRDMFQCVDERVKVLYVRTGAKGAELVDAAAVEARYGIPPALVPDFIALRGDPSDGIPGARGVGEKTAASLLRRYGSLEGALTGKLAAAADELRTFKRMAQLRRLELDRPPDRETDRARGADAVRARGMRRLAERLTSSARDDA